MASFLKLGSAQLAMLAALGLFAGAVAPASAADLGGDCCADLEERIAELEATTARKGNRKVSLEVSGHVNQAVLFWDDGEESNVGVYTNDNARSRFRFKGDAKIVDGWKAGYLLEIGVRSARSNRFTQDEDNGVTDSGLDIRHSVWYLDSKSYGRLWVGQTGGAAEGVTEINLANTKDVNKYSDQEDSGLGLVALVDGRRVAAADGTEYQWRRFIRDNGNQPGEGRRYNLIRYDTPEIMGFVGTVNFGEDDTWEVGLRNKGEFGGFKYAAGIAYGEASNAANSISPTPGGDNVPNQVGFECIANGVSGGAPFRNSDKDADCEQLGGSISVMHSESGLYANFAGGWLKDNLIDRNGRGPDPDGAGPLLGPDLPADDTSTFFAVEAGIERKWIALGKTTLFGQYYRNDAGSSFRDVSTADGDAGTERVIGTEMESYSIGVVQNVEAAAMDFYLFWRHYEGELETTTSAGVRDTLDVDDLEVVMGGAMIKF